MRKRLLLGTAAIILPLLMSACSEYEGLPVPGIAEEEVSALRGTAHDLGVFHFSIGNYGLAVQHFQAATSRNTQSVEGWNGLAASYDKINRFDLAERYYRRALRVDPQSAQTLNNLGYSYWLQGRYDLALAHLRDADRLDGGNRVIEANRKLARDAYLASRNASDNVEIVDVDEESAALLATIEVDTGPRIERLTNRVQSLITRPNRHEEIVLSSSEPVETDSNSLSGLGADATPSVDAPVRPVTLAHDEPGDEAAAAVSLHNEVLAQNYIASGSIDPRDEKPEAIQVTQVSSPINLAAQMLEKVEPPTLDQATLLLESTDTPTSPYNLASVESSSYAKVVVDPVAPRIEVANGVGRDGMAERLGRFLALRGLPHSNLKNAEDFDRDETVILYREGWQVYAMGLASLFPAKVRLEQSAAVEDEVSADIRIEIGGDLLRFDGELIAELPSDDDISG